MKIIEAPLEFSLGLALVLIIVKLRVKCQTSKLDPKIKVSRAPTHTPPEWAYKQWD